MADDDEHKILRFQPGLKSKARRRPGQTNSGTDPEDMIAAVAVIAALVFAVAMVSRWVPISLHTLALTAVALVLAGIAKLVKARRLRASVTDLPRHRR